MRARWAWADGHITPFKDHRYIFEGNTPGVYSNASVAPPLGIRSAPPLGGLGSGTVELRADGTIAVNGVARAQPPLQCADAEAPLAEAAAAPAAARGAGTVSRVIPEGYLFVLGDCPARSTDSRTWGPLPEENVVGRPVVRIWPPERQGTIDDSVDLNPFVRR